MRGVQAAAPPPPLAVVLASTAPGYATGQVLERAAVEIPDGASTTFLLPSGQAVTSTRQAETAAQRLNDLGQRLRDLAAD